MAKKSLSNGCGQCLLEVSEGQFCRLDDTTGTGGKMQAKTSLRFSVTGARNEAKKNKHKRARTMDFILSLFRDSA